MRNLREDKCLAADEWCDILDRAPSFDRKDIVLEKGNTHWFFIQCEDDVVMIRKEYWRLLLEDTKLLE